MTELEFRNTNPTSYGKGNVNLLYSSSISTGSYELPANHYGPSGSFSYDLVLNNVQTGGHGKEYYLKDAFFPPYRVLGLTIPYNSANDVALEQTLAQINKVKLTVGGTPVTVRVTQIAKNAGYYFIRTQPKDIFSFPTEVDNSGTPYDLTVEFIFDPYLADKFSNSDFNALIGNASDNVQIDIALQVDRTTDQLTPSNLDAIISKTATKAQLQYSNYTLKGWTNARYEGTKINSGSIEGDDPAMAFKSFKGSLHPLDADVATILTAAADGDTNTKALYFKVDRKPTDYLRIGEPFYTGSTFPTAKIESYYTSSVVSFDTGSGNYTIGPRVIRGYEGDIIYERDGGSFVRIVDTKIHASDKGSVFTTNEFGRVVSEQTS